MKDNTKITLTLKQIKKLVKESNKVNTPDDAVKVMEDDNPIVGREKAIYEIDIERITDGENEDYIDDYAGVYHNLEDAIEDAKHAVSTYTKLGEKVIVTVYEQEERDDGNYDEPFPVWTSKSDSDDVSSQIKEDSFDIEDDPTADPDKPEEKIKKWYGDTKCDFCHRDCGKTLYDGMTGMGPWAVMCEPCFHEYGVGLGPGKGQKYKKVGDEYIQVDDKRKSAAKKRASRRRDVSDWEREFFPELFSEGRKSKVTFGQLKRLVKESIPDRQDDDKEECTFSEFRKFAKSLGYKVTSKTWDFGGFGYGSSRFYKVFSGDRLVHVLNPKKKDEYVSGWWDKAMELDPELQEFVLSHRIVDDRDPSVKCIPEG